MKCLHGEGRGGGTGRGRCTDRAGGRQRGTETGKGRAEMSCDASNDRTDLTLSTLTLWGPTGPVIYSVICGHGQKNNK